MVRTRYLIPILKTMIAGSCCLGLLGCNRESEPGGAAQVESSAKPAISETAERTLAAPAEVEKPGRDHRRSAADAEADQTLRIYRELYSSGVIRPIRFDQEADPNETAREEIFLEAEFAQRAEETTLSQDRALLADIDYYQGVEILNAWLRQQVADEEITTQAVEAYYQANREKFTRPEEVVFHHLFLLVPPGDENVEYQKREQIEKLRRQSGRGAEFERLVTEYSELPGAKHDSGKVGPVQTGRLNKAIQTALRELEPGEISEPVRTPYGWELLRLDERTSETVASLEDVRQRIVNELLLEKTKAVQSKASEQLQKLYPAKVNEDLLSGSEPLTSGAVVLTIGSRTLTVADVLDAIQATYAFGGIKDERERIRAALPRIIMTEQVKEAARQEGLLATPEMRTKMRLIRNRLLGEQMYKRHVTSRNPTEEEVRAEYEANKATLFRTPPQAKGILYNWNLEAEETTSGAQMAFSREVLRQKVEEIAQKARTGQISREELAEQASKVTDLGWFREGPMGYEHDMAFFKTQPGNYTPLIPTKQGWALGYVEARKESEPLPYDQHQEQIRRFVIRERSEEERKGMVEEILKQYARGT